MCVRVRAQVLRLDSVWVISAIFLTTTMSWACPRSTECSLALSAWSRNSSFVTAWFMLSAWLTVWARYFSFHTHILIFFHWHMQQVSVLRLVTFTPAQQETAFPKKATCPSYFWQPGGGKEAGNKRGFFYFFFFLKQTPLSHDWKSHSITVRGWPLHWFRACSRVHREKAG